MHVYIESKGGGVNAWFKRKIIPKFREIDILF